VSQTSGFFARQRSLRLSIHQFGALCGAAFSFAVGIALPAQAGAMSPKVETASVVAAPLDFRFASINPALAQPIQDVPDFDFLIETEADVAADGSLDPHWYNHFGNAEAGRYAQAALNERFQSVAERADLSPGKLASLFDKARVSTPPPTTRQPKPLAVADAAPVRFASVTAPVDVDARLALAYADPSPATSTGALGAIARMAPADGEALSSTDADDPLLLPGQNDLSQQEDLPSAVPLPGMRPQVSRPARDMAEPLQPNEGGRGDDPKLRREGPKRPQLAYARPDNPDDQTSDRPGWGLKKLLGRPRAGKGVAVYDISAARVYMPDGSVLEAHSGIGKMVDNPKYVHVKMNGPTPPSTYNLRMRESRFHGVEAIRMLPVDGKNPHGRTGLLTHSYLLRGGRAESHGCVAFKDYNKFLTAFKKGRVKQLVVVPGGGRGTLLARNG
jgi:hypothetical protein